MFSYANNLYIWKHVNDCVYVCKGWGGVGGRVIVYQSYKLEKGEIRKWTMYNKVNVSLFYLAKDI